MRLIGEAMDDLNRDAIADAARRSPGENVEIGLRLGDAALRIRQHDRDDRPGPVSLTEVRNRLRRERGEGSRR